MKTVPLAMIDDALMGETFVEDPRSEKVAIKVRGMFSKLERFYHEFSQMRRRFGQQMMEFKKFEGEEDAHQHWYRMGDDQVGTR